MLLRISDARYELSRRVLDPYGSHPTTDDLLGARHIVDPSEPPVYAQSD